MKRLINDRNGHFSLSCVLSQLPCAAAVIRGSSRYCEIWGEVKLYQTNAGVLVTAEVSGLPKRQDAECNLGDFFAFHLHNGTACSGNADDPFADAGSHYNKNSANHPCHNGDFPPLLSNEGYAFSAFLTNRFTVEEVIGKTVIIHAGHDDFTSQPAGNAGAKIACGKIMPVCR